MNELSEFIESYLSVVMVSIASSRAQPRVASQPHLLAEMKNYSQKRLHPHYSGLDPTQKQMDFEIHFTRENKQRAATSTNQEKPCHAWLLLVCSFRGNSFFSVTLCDCAGEPTQVIGTLVPNSLLLFQGSWQHFPPLLSPDPLHQFGQDWRNFWARSFFFNSRIFGAFWVRMERMLVLWVTESWVVSQWDSQSI